MPNSPRKLDDTYSPVLLYNFEGNLLDSGSAGEDLEMSSGTARYGAGIEPGTKGFFYSTQSDLVRGINATAVPAARILGDITIQAVFRMSEFGIGSFGSSIVSCLGPSTNLEADNHPWIFTFANNATLMSPQLQWEYGASGTRVIVENTDFTLTVGQWYHVALRRTDIGGGDSLGEVIVNQSPIASLVAPNATGGTNTRIYLADTNIEMRKCLLSSIKVVDRALTDDELAAEFERTLEKI